MLMNKGNIINNTITRRKGSMLQDIMSKIKYLLVLAFLLVLPMLVLPTQAMAGFGTLPLIDQTDTGVNRLIYYWDTRDRDTLFQLTNTSTSTIVVHIQIFNVGSPALACEEVNWDDVYTQGDTHVYDIENLVSNCTADGLPNGECEAAPNPDLSNSYGFVSISLISGDDFAMIGLFRILDGPGGYEYRTNAAGEDFFADETIDFILNFNSVDGNNLSDVIGITYEEIDFDTVFAGPGVATTFGDVSGDPFADPTPSVFIFDEFEDGTSCSPTFFDCFPGEFNRGIDNSIPNSRQADLNNRICNASTLSESNDAGWLFLPFFSFDFGFNFEGDHFFVGFLGLNNGNGTGSMDSWLAAGIEGELLPLEPGLVTE
jgi:hypothetical protein